MDLETPPFQLQSLLDVFDTAMLIHKFISTLRSGAGGVRFWLLDMYLFNLHLQKNEHGLALSAFDYTWSEMCCLDQMCGSIARDIASSVQDLAFNLFDKKDLVETVQPCSSLNATYLAKLDERILELWVTDVFTMLVEGAVHLLGRPPSKLGLHDAQQRHVRHIYASEWYRACGQHKQGACQNLFDQLADAYRISVLKDKTLPPEGVPWSESSKPLFQALVAA